MIRFFINLWLTLWLSFLTAALVQSQRPGDFSAVQGLDTAQGIPIAGTPNLKDRMEEATQRRVEPLTITEAQANHYLAEIITGRQGHLTGWYSNFEHVALQFEHGVCRLWFIWKVHNRTCTATLDFTVRREGTNFVTEIQGGSYGRMPIPRRGALATLVPACRSLCSCLDDDREIKALFLMNQIRFEKHQMILDPRFEPGAK